MRCQELYPLSGIAHQEARRNPIGPWICALTPARYSETLYAFYLEHQRCGELDGGAGEEWIWMTCTCGAVISRTLEPAHRQ